MDNPTKLLLTDIEQFLEQTGTPPSVFGSRSVGDPNFVFGLRAGREPRFGTMKRVRDFIAQAASAAETEGT